MKKLFDDFWTSSGIVEQEKKVTFTTYHTKGCGSWHTCEVNYVVLLYNDYIVQYVSLPSVKLQFLCTICHNKHHILYIETYEITQFISHMSWTTIFCVVKVSVVIYNVMFQCLCLHLWFIRHFDNSYSILIYENEINLDISTKLMCKSSKTLNTSISIYFQMNMLELLILILASEFF